MFFHCQTFHNILLVIYFILINYHIYIYIKQVQNMKKLTSLILLLNSIVIISSVANAQAPQSIPYQAVARDSIGNPIANQNISLRFSVHDATANGTVVYRETHNATTNPLGLFTVNIGNGTIISGTFTTIDWGGGSKFMQVEMDATGGTSYVDMGAQQMLSVPYALNAANGNWTKSGNDIYKSNSGNVGIGTSTPNANLHVVGNIKMNDGNEGIGKILKSDSNGLASWGMLSGADILTTQPNALSLSCPVVAGSVGTGSGPNALVVSGNYLYIACSAMIKCR